jgi:hypothetical protein
MECLNYLLINTILDIVNQISSSVIHLSSGLAGIRTPGLDRHNGLGVVIRKIGQRCNRTSLLYYCLYGNTRKHGV